MGRNWMKAPAERMRRNLAYRTRYGQGIPAPSSMMLQNLREQEEDSEDD